MDLNSLLAMVKAHQWIAFTAVIIGALTRAFKDDPAMSWCPISLSPRWSPPIALGLGLVSGVLNNLVSGMPLQQAILGGLGAAMTAMVAHDSIVSCLRNGKDLFVTNSKAAEITKP